MFCMKCGNKLPDNAAFCNRCGAQMNQMNPMNQMQQAAQMNQMQQAAQMNQMQQTPQMPQMNPIGQMQQMPQMGAMQQPYPYAAYGKKNNRGLAVVAIISAVLSVPLLILGFMKYNEGGYRYSWSPPFSLYELLTLSVLTVGGLALLLAIILGIIILVRKSS